MGTEAEAKSICRWKPWRSTKSHCPGRSSCPIKNTREIGKLAPKLETKPYTVLTNERHQVTMESSEGAAYKRDSSSVRPEEVWPSG